MFKKAADATASSATLLRGKEGKQLKEAAAFQFRADTTSVDRLFPGKSIESCKLGGGGKLGYADSGDKLPVLIDLDPKAGLGKGKLLPTIFALWRSPELLPALLIPAHVVSFILKGADLMWPGVHHDHLPAVKLGKGSLVSIRVVGNPAPLAVGELLCSLEDAKEAGFRGRAVGILHCYRDALWESCGRPLPNGGYLQTEIRPVPEGAEELARIGNVVASAADNDSTASDGGKEGETAAAGAGKEEEGEGEGTGKAEAGTGEDGGAASSSEEGTATGSAPPPKTPYWETLSPDELFRATFLQALKRRVKDKELPILAARLYGAEMQPAAPIGHEIDIKVTKWKKFAVFLQDMASEGLIKLAASAAGGGGEDLAVVGVNRSHDALSFFKPWPAAMEQAAATAAANAAAAMGGDASAAMSAGPSGGTMMTVDGLIAPASSSVAGYRPPLFLSLFAPPPSSYSIFRTVLRPSRKAAPPAPPLWTPQFAGFKVDEIKSASPTIVSLLAQAALSSSSSSASKKDSSAAGGAKGIAGHAHDLHRCLDMKGRLFTQAEVVAALRAYIAEEELGHPKDPSRIILDLAVADALVGDMRQDAKHDAALFKTADAEAAEKEEGSEDEGEGGRDDDENEDEEEEEEEAPPVPVPTKAAMKDKDRDAASMSRVDVAKLYMKRMTPFTVIVFPNAAAAVSASNSGASATQASLASYLAGDAVLFRGPLPKVSLHVKKLQGGKKHMTFVAGLASYRIDEAAFAKECSRRFASSSSVTCASDAGIPAVGDAHAKNVVQLQGEVAEPIGELLISAKDGYGLPKAVVKGVWDDEDDEDGDGGKGGKKKGGAAGGAGGKKGGKPAGGGGGGGSGGGGGGKRK